MLQNFPKADTVKLLEYIFDPSQFDIKKDLTQHLLGLSPIEMRAFNVV